MLEFLFSFFSIFFLGTTTMIETTSLATENSPVVTTEVATSDGGAAENLSPFVSCLKEKGAKFYGASWCPHCQSQKALFGAAANELPYVECADTEGGQQDLCAALNIVGYPTWIFSGGVRHEGEMTLQELSDKTGCELS